MDRIDTSQTIVVDITEKMKSAYMDYSMSIIIGRALPDFRDGLKPVHRRILYAMLKEGLLPDKRYSKCAGVVGEVLKKYHPHGDSAVYDALVRMAQPWNMRLPLIDGQGNFGSIDGDSAAAYRYTECRLSKPALYMLLDIDKDTVDFVPNFDNSQLEPVVLPTRLPNLLINGSSGIAVGMATNIPPHNPSEVIDATIALIKDREIGLKEIMEYLPGPDFPTGGIINGIDGIVEAYKTGRGKIKIRGKAYVETNKNTKQTNLIITELPYQVNKSELLARIAQLVNEKKIEGVRDIRDESNKDGIRVVIELKKDASSNVVLNKLYKHTNLETTFGINLLGIDQGRPRSLGIKEVLEIFIRHREQVIVRRTRYLLREAEARLHILEGLILALDNIDRVIELIRSSKSPDEAKIGLIREFSMTEIQAQAVLNMRLQRLTGLEREKLLEEMKELKKKVKEYREILTDYNRLKEVMIEELIEIKEKFGDPRRTEIIETAESLSLEDVIVQQDVVVTVTYKGKIKRRPLTQINRQRRGGKGTRGLMIKDGDFVCDLFVANTHSYILIFTDSGKCYWLKVYELPDLGRIAKGVPIINLIDVEPGEKIKAILPVKTFEEGYSIVMATAMGMIKKTNLMEYSRPRRSGIIAINIREGDELIDVGLSGGGNQIFIATKKGFAIRFDESEVREMGRNTTGVTGIRLNPDDRVVSMDIVREGYDILTITENGYGKRTAVSEYRLQKRGGKGLINIKCGERNGDVVKSLKVKEQDEVMIITDDGLLIRTSVSEISRVGRNTKGVKIINIGDDSRVSSMVRVISDE